MISVKKITETTFEVTVESDVTTKHTVTVTDDYHTKLVGDTMSKEELVKESFKFLLNNEPNTSILLSFELPVIQTYFSNYESEIQKLG